MESLSKERKEELSFDNFSYNREYVYRQKFIMLNNCYLQPDIVKLIQYAEKTLDRKNAIKQIDEIIRCLPVSQLIELGVFEFSINYVKTHDLNSAELEMVYVDKVNDLCLNLDMSNINIKNKTLLPAILRGEINPQTVAFMKFHHLHPENWKTIKYHLIGKSN